MAELVSNHRVQVQDPPIAHALFTDTRFAIIWLIIRVYVGYQWLVAGYDKLISPDWVSGASMTGFAAFFGGLMNANYLLSGTVSINPLLFIFATWLVLAWRVAGYYGADRWVLPLLGVPGQPGKIFTHDKTEAPKPQAARAAG